MNKTKLKWKNTIDNCVLKYSEINLIKYVQDMYMENYQTNEDYVVFMG